MGGRCLEHGPGAIRKWKPKKTAVVGKGGKVMMQYVGGREYYWVCDLDTDKKSKLRQTTLGFLKTTALLKTTSICEDNPIVDKTSSPNLKQSNATVGQGE